MCHLLFTFKVKPVWLQPTAKAQLTELQMDPYTSENEQLEPENDGFGICHCAPIPSASGLGVGFRYRNTFSQGIWSSIRMMIFRTFQGAPYIAEGSSKVNLPGCNSLILRMLGLTEQRKIRLGKAPSLPPRYC